MDIINHTKRKTDGSPIGSPGPTGAGGVLRNEWGGWINGFQRRVGITNSLIAELWALKDDLTLAKDLDIDLIYVESDAKEVINLILEEPNDDKPLMPLILDCRLLLESFRGCKFRHIFREANKVADVLAKKAGKMDNSFIVHSRPPDFVSLPMMFDCQGQTETRVVVDDIG